MTIASRAPVPLDADARGECAEPSAGRSREAEDVMREATECPEVREALGAFVADLDERFGEPDPAQVEEYARLFR
ncbi:MAG: hypothetical protein LBL01_07085 [Bifidobacteriaceae bacterium]|jgi:hypothetical protein|nr:hypothetical protein [Bifidobacteriaceae bacterium]